MIWNIQETKCVREGSLKLNGYRVFVKVRSNQNGGGGLAIGCSIKLSPVLTRNGGDEVEAITVNIRIQNMNLICCTAYGPQNSDNIEKKDNFWEYLDEETKMAERKEMGFILQGDLNSWL